MTYITVYINNKKIKVKPNTTVLEACEQTGIYVPRFCYHERLQVAGNCRMCLVEIEKAPKPVASCAFPVSKDLKIFTDTPLVKKARENVIEFLLINHPLDCPICDQGGECDLQEQTLYYGSDRSRFFHKKRGVEDKNCGPFIKTIMTRCIHCTRCVRFFQEIAGNDELGTTARGKDTEIGTYLEKNLGSELSGNIIDLCPVGALTSKPYAFSARPWELKSTQSIDALDAAGSNIKVDFKESEIVRILPLQNDEINEEWISDKTRFMYDAFNSNRLAFPFLQLNKKNWIQLSWKQIIKILISLFQYNIILSSKKPKHKNLIFAGTMLDYESLSLLRKFADNLNFLFKKEENIENDNLLFLARVNSTLIRLSDSDLILTLGSNPKLESAIYNMKIKKRTRAGNFVKASIGIYDEALNYKNVQLGNSLKTFFKILEGQNKFCKELSQAKFPLLIINSNFFKRIKIDKLGTILRYLNRNIRIVQEDWVGLDTISFSSNYLTQNKRTPKLAKKFDLLYKVGINNHNELKKYEQKVSLNQTSFGKKDDNILLPIPLFTEISKTFINFEGKPQKTNKIFNGPSLVKDNTTIFNLLLTLLLKKKTPAIFEPKLLQTTDNKLDFTKFLLFDKISISFCKIDFSTLKGETNNFFQTKSIYKISSNLCEAGREIRQFYSTY